jgi:acetyltransferase
LNDYDIIPEDIPIPFVVGIFSDNAKSKASEIGKKYGLPVFTNDIRKFYADRNKKITDKKVREKFDNQTLSFLEPLAPDVIAYAGYVWGTTAPLVNAFLGINVHPADLTIKKMGKRAYAGANGVRDTLLGKEAEIRSTAHIVTSTIDAGPILMLSEAVPIQDYGSISLEEASRKYLHLVNKEARELFPRVIKDLSMGKFKIDQACLLLL